jgi:predicted nucleic acid-binding protein
MAKAKPRPFVDTNVLFSGLYSPSGAPATILERHVRGDLTMVISR